MPVLSKELFDIWTNIECWFTLRCVHDVTRTYSQLHRTDNYSQFISISWLVWPNGAVFVYKLNGCRFESRCSHFNFKYRYCFEYGVTSHSDKYRVWIPSETSMWLEWQELVWQEHTIKRIVKISTYNSAQSFGQFGQLIECSFTNYVVKGSGSVAVT